MERSPRQSLHQHLTNTDIAFTGLTPEQLNADIHNALETLHRDFLQALQQLQEEQAAREFQQFRDRLQLNQKARSDALGELAGVLNPRAKELYQEGDPLLIAAGAVGRAMGLTIQPPARSENLDRCKNPLDAIARASRIRTRKVLLDSNWWRRYAGPLLAYKEENGAPVALLPIPGDRYELYNPALRHRIQVSEAIAQQLAPEAYTFYRSLPDRAIDGLQFIQFGLRGQEKNLLLLVVVGVLATLLGMLTPQATAVLIDKAIPSANRRLILEIGGGLLAASFGVAIFQLVQALTILRVQAIGDSISQAGLWDRLMKLPLSFFRQYSSGDLLIRVSAINQIRERLGGSIVRTLFSSLFAILNLGLMLFYSVKLAIVALCIGFVTLLITGLSGRITRKKLRPLQELEGKISGLMVQLIGGVSKLRVAGAEERAFAYWSKFYTQKIRFVLSTQAIEDGVNAFNQVLPLLSSIVIFIATALLIKDASKGGGLSLTAGKYLAFNAAFGIFITGVTELSNTIIDVLDATILWERAQPILAAQPEVTLEKADPGKLYGEVTLDRVSFRYRPDGALTLDRITIAAKAGEFIALVGPSGSGKSTIVRLLLGFETPEDGTIYYDGQDLSGLDIDAIRRQLGIVLQNGRIQSASIFENIIGGQLATIDEAWKAAEMAGFAGDIQGMPMGMHTVISEGGSNLSGGQKQRLLISRALVSKPNILIFDEATSALDNQTQRVVMESLEQLKVTRITIAHRLSTIRQADRIYVLDTGQIVQVGTFEELSHTPGLFAQLMTRQLAER
ncbi:NHLP bacteriocin export ABC transporter permease/ATPase subunit [Spirulina sp. 06S082]|uniref:NHLP bacteriocin export ABC transporter permease/ATPase subunit n=1 Tax=Spirulina sp. 06S082 TaxID=3110248 RepID=UPI002B1EE5A8|nr:NHLP bacteriocin export ABC transporter permease/ATPase subunit [Spirulina sp. 06S082]MEA5468232.1 NHLP bacteriocin export ABC transporter permease/ATPase subunit [Spirulina sp. 06S082]